MNNIITPEEIINEALRLKDKLSDTEFPVHVFPKQVQEIIRATSECSDYPMDFISPSVLFAASVAIGNTHCVEVKTNWIETPILFLAIVGSPGINKTHPLSFAIQPLLDKDIQVNTEYRKAIKEYDDIMAMGKKEREENMITDTPIEPKLKKYIVSDITPESLASILEDNPRGIALYADELASWFNNFNRYSKGSEEQFWLMAFSASPIQINRKNIRGSISIKRPYISVSGTIQPDLLRDLAEGSRSKNGFIDRILFAYPPRLQKKYWSTEELPSNITKSWHSIISGLIDLEQCVDDNGSAIPQIIKYSPEAWGKLYEWHKYNTDLANDTDKESIKGIYSKLEIYISRFALTLQMLRFRCGESTKEQIDTQSIEGAIAIVEYFRTTALRVQQTLNAGELFKEIPTETRKLYDALPKDFSTAEGVQIAERFNMSRDSFNRFIKQYKDILLENYKRGFYKKLI